MNKLILLLLCSFNISVAQDTLLPIAKKAKPAAEWKTLDDSIYTVQYPGDWELNPQGISGTNFFIFSPAESVIDSFRENINLIVQDLTGQNIDLSKFTEISEGQLKTMATNSELIESKRILNPTGEYHKLVYSAQEGIYRLIFEQYYIVRNDHAYILTFSGEKDRFPLFKETAERVMNSFTFKK